MKPSVKTTRANTVVKATDATNCSLRVTATVREYNDIRSDVRITARDRGRNTVFVDLPLDEAAAFARGILTLVSELQGHGANCAAREETGIERAAHRLLDIASR